jgi:hypothetical protein
MTQNRKTKSGKTHLSIPEQTIPSSAATCNRPTVTEAIRLETANQKQVVTSLYAVSRAMAGASVLPNRYMA